MYEVGKTANTIAEMKHYKIKFATLCEMSWNEGSFEDSFLSTGEPLLFLGLTEEDALHSEEGPYCSKKRQRKS